MSLISRAEVKNEDKWNIEALYKSNKEWNEDFEKIKDVKTELSKLLKFKGNLKDLSPSSLKDLIELQLSTSRKIIKLYVYSHLK